MFEINSSENEACVVVQRSYSFTGAVKVDWFTRENTAIADVDYAEANGTLNFLDNEREKLIRIPLLSGSDHDESENKSFIVELGGCDENASIGLYEATVILCKSKYHY